MRLLIFILDAMILVAIFLTAAWLFTFGYDRGRKEAKQAKKPDKKNGRKTRRSYK